VYKLAYEDNGLDTERQKLFARDLSGHPAEALIASTVRIEGKRSDGRIRVGTGFMFDFSFRRIDEYTNWSVPLS
jgi:hypothetical protein